MLKSSLPDVYRNRRDRLAHDHPGCAFMLASAPETTRNSDVTHPYRQESHFYYLSAFDEPFSCLLILPARDPGAGHRFVLFLQERNQEREIWTGERYGLERARTVFGADEAYPFSALQEKLPGLLADVERVYYQFGLHAGIDQVFHRMLEQQKSMNGRTGRGILPIFDYGPIIGEMRLRKDEHDLASLRKACKITAEAHLALMRGVKPGMPELEAQALIEYEFARGGCERLGYPSIVAGGKNATCLHYTRNNEILAEGDLLLVDAGGEYGYFTSDITRTYPVGKKFSAEQAAIYDIVFEAHQEALKICAPGATIAGIHDKTVEVIVDGLLSLGLLRGKRAEIIEKKAFTRFYPHRSSHWLGMDVHDVGLYQASGVPRPLEEGMVFTLEPGVYCQPDDPEVPEAFRGIGVRIEDDLLIRVGGHENLTSSLPSARADVEAVRAG